MGVFKRFGDIKAFGTTDAKYFHANGGVNVVYRNVEP